MQRKRRRWGMLLAAVALCVGAAGCNVGGGQAPNPPPQPQSVAATPSPDGYYSIEGFSTDAGTPVSGETPVEQVRVVETGSGEAVWSMDGPVLLYATTPFVWSPDSAYVSVACAGRTWRDGLVVDTENRTARPLPGMAELAPLFPDTTPDGDRPDPYIDPLRWLEDRKLLVSFSWRVQEDMEGEDGRISGTYEFHAETGEITLRDEGGTAS